MANPNADSAHDAFRRRFIIVGACIASVTLLAFSSVCWHDFVNMDDDYYISANYHVRSGLTWAGASWALTTLHAANWHPLTWLSLMADTQVFGTNPAGYHFTNLLLHVANTLLIYWLFYRMTRCPWRSAAVSALFALHPLHVESVAWASERKDVLSTFFGLLSLLAYVNYAATLRTASYLLVVVSFALSLLAKPMLVTLPFLMLLLDYWPLGRWRRPPAATGANSSAIGSPRELRWLIVEKLPLLVLIACSCVVTLRAQWQGGAVSSMGALRLGDRLANAATAYVTYLRQMVLPLDLAFLYPVPAAGPNMANATLAGLFLLAISAAVIWMGPRYGFLPVGWFWYLGTLFPVIGLVQVGLQAHADRYTYFPLIGIFLLLVWLFSELAERWNWTRIAAVAMVLILVACTLATWRQVQFWRNSATIWEHCLAVAEPSAQAHNSLGLALAQQGNDDRAITHYESAIQLAPNHLIGAMAHYNLGLLLAKGQQQDVALANYERCLEIVGPIDNDLGRRLFAECMNSMGVLHLRRRENDQAVELFRGAVRADPQYAKAHFNLGIAEAQAGRLDPAHREFLTAVRCDPEYAQAYFCLAEIQVEQGAIAEALPNFERAVQLVPQDLAYQKRLTEVVSQFRRAR